MTTQNTIPVNSPEKHSLCSVCDLVANLKYASKSK